MTLSKVQMYLIIRQEGHVSDGVEMDVGNTASGGVASIVVFEHVLKEQLETYRFYTYLEARLGPYVGVFRNAVVRSWVELFLLALLFQ